MGSTNFQSEKMFGPAKIWNKNITSKNFWSKLIVDPEKYFWSEKKFGVHKNLGLKTMFGPKEFWIKKNV